MTKDEFLKLVKDGNEFFKVEKPMELIKPEMDITDPNSIIRYMESLGWSTYQQLPGHYTVVHERMRTELPSWSDALQSCIEVASDQ